MLNFAFRKKKQSSKDLKEKLFLMDEKKVSIGFNFAVVYSYIPLYSKYTSQWVLYRECELSFPDPLK